MRGINCRVYVQKPSGVWSLHQSGELDNRPLLYSTTAYRTTKPTRSQNNKTNQIKKN